MIFRRLVSASMVACVLLAPAVSWAGRGTWREMTVGHFHLISTLGDEATRDIARQLQAFEETVGRLLQSDEHLPDIPTDIYVLDHHDFLYYTVGRTGLVGVFRDQPYRNLLTIDGSRPFKDVRTTVFHEYTHFIQRNSTTKHMPPWFTEGYAEFFSSFDLDDKTVTVGELPPGVGIVMDHWIPMERVLAVSMSDPEYRAEQLAPQFYGESWLLVHYLMFDDKALAASTAAYLEYLDVGLSEPEAFAKAFQFDKPTLDQKIRELVKNRNIHVRKVTLKDRPAVESANMTQMTDTQADAALLRAGFMFGCPAKILDPLRADVLKHHPTDPTIVALNARVAAHFGEKSDLGDLVGQLSAMSGADYPQLRIDVADTLLTRAALNKGADDAAGSAAHDAAAILDDLVHTQDPPVEAVAIWATVELDVNPVITLEALKPLAARVPHNTQVLGQLAQVSEILGDRRAARSYYERIILVSDQPEERLWAQKQADSARLQ